MGHYTIFKLENQRFGLPLGQIQEILPMMAFTPIPHCPPFIKGVINARGGVIPIMDLRTRLNYPFSPYTLNSHLLVTSWENHKVALAVDQVEDVLFIEDSSLETPLSSFPMVDLLKNVARVDDTLVLILHLPNLLDFETFPPESLEEILAEDSSEGGLE